MVDTFQYKVEIEKLNKNYYFISLNRNMYAWLKRYRNNLNMDIFAFVITYLNSNLNSNNRFNYILLDFYKIIFK